MPSLTVTKLNYFNHHSKYDQKAEPQHATLLNLNPEVSEIVLDAAAMPQGSFLPVSVARLYVKCGIVESGR